LSFECLARAASYLALAVIMTVPSSVMAEGDSIPEAYDRISKSVVLIRVDGVRMSADPREIAATTSSGSGFAVEPGLVVTNYHVIADAVRIEVVLRGGESAAAEVVGTAPGYDLALLRVPFSGKNLPPAKLNGKNPLRVGETILTLGHALGGEHSLTAGIVSGLNRNLPGSELGSSLIQFDAPINPGQSGGPLVDIHGRVVGVTTAKIVGAEALGFAVPSGLVAATIPDLKSMGHPFRPNIGMAGAAVDPSLARIFGLSVQEGVMVERVEPGSIAEKSGLEAGHRHVFLRGQDFVLGGDIVVGIDGTLIQGPGDLTRALLSARPGAEVELSVVRRGKGRKLILEIPEMEH